MDIELLHLAHFFPALWNVKPKDMSLKETHNYYFCLTLKN